jgi:hypothetical protein
MSRPTGFSMRTLFVVTAVAAISLLPIVKPSVWWAALFPAAACLATVRTASLYVPADDQLKAFWGPFTIGVAAYLAAVMFVGYVAFLGEANFWGGVLTVRLWMLVHGDADSPDVTPYDFVAFTVSVHLVIACVTSLLATEAVKSFATKTPMAPHASSDEEGV